MSISKRFLKHPRTIILFSYILASYIHLVYATSRKNILIDDEALPYVNGAENGIFAFWHGRMMMLPLAYPKQRPMHVLISQHRDGVLISKVIEHFHLSTISGSSSKGGGEAVRNMLKALEAGENVSITPDGPRGPTQQVVSGGVVSVAKLSQKPIIPVAFSASRCIRLNSWDKFMLVRPFSKITFCVAAPIFIPEHADDTPQGPACQEVEHILNRLVEIADGAVS
jgi:lysophospholipid acyltransferase (LPLAT)-like uncharacterized protein